MKNKHTSRSKKPVKSQTNRKKNASTKSQQGFKQQGSKQGSKQHPKKPYQQKNLNQQPREKKTPPIIVLFNKPFGVQSQFRNDDGNQYGTLSDYFDDKSLRIAGRLDATSEGLLILTGNGKLDGQINKAITHPPHAHSKANKHKKQGKTYLVQVEGIPTEQQLAQLSKGVTLKDGKTLPAKVEHITENELPIPLWTRNPPIRERKSIPTAWLMMTIYEGKNRQVRRMTAHVGLPCLRLIRWSVAGFDLGELAVGESVRVTLSGEELRRLGL